MLSYKQWKTLNESVLPSFTLGVSGPQNIGLQLQSGFDLEEGKHAKKKKEPKVEVEVEEKEDSKKDKKCGKMCGKMCSKCSKMLSDEEDYEDEDKDHDEEECGKEDHEEEDHDEDHEEEHDEEDHDEEDHDEEDHDEEDKKNVNMKMSKKKMLKGDQHKIDANRDGRITADDFKILRKKKKKNEQAELDAWWNSVNNMAGPMPGTKFDDGLFQPIDQENLTQAVREEPAPGEVGYAPAARIGGALGGNSLEEGMVTSKKDSKPAKKWKWEKEDPSEEAKAKDEAEEDDALEKEYEGEQGTGVRFNVKKKSKKN
jgi:hypothetical protein